MAQKRFLVAANLASLLITGLLFTLFGPLSVYDEFLLDDIDYMITGILFALAFLFSAVSIYIFIANKKRLIMGISTICSAIISLLIPILCWNVSFLFIIILVLVAAVPCVLFFLAIKFVKEDNSKGLFQLLASFMFCALFCLLPYRILSVVGIITALIGYFFYSMPKLKKLPFHIITVVFMIAGLGTLIIEIAEEGPLGVFFFSALSVILGIFYFVVSYSAMGKKFSAALAELLCGAKETENGVSDQLSKDQILNLQSLQKLREAGVLTEEEFQEQKNKILGGDR